ncbi:MAG: hypothetical protein ACJAW3_001605 [Lentimonas sp.]|jgi:hypothetical protein
MLFNCRTSIIQTDAGTTKIIMPPWNGVMNGFTLLFEALIVSLTRKMTGQ